MLPIICLFILLALSTAAPQGSDLVTFPTLPDGLGPGMISPPPGMGEMGGMAGMVSPPPGMGEMGGMAGMVSPPPGMGEMGGMAGMVSPPPGMGEMGGMAGMMTPPSAVGGMMTPPTGIDGIMSQVPSNQMTGCGGNAPSGTSESENEPETMSLDSDAITA